MLPWWDPSTHSIVCWLGRVSALAPWSYPEWLARRPCWVASGFLLLLPSVVRPPNSPRAVVRSTAVMLRMGAQRPATPACPGRRGSSWVREGALRNFFLRPLLSRWGPMFAVDVVRSHGRRRRSGLIVRRCCSRGGAASRSSLSYFSLLCHAAFFAAVLVSCPNGHASAVANEHAKQCACMGNTPDEWKGGQLACCFPGSSLSIGCGLAVLVAGVKAPLRTRARFPREAGRLPCTASSR